MREYSGLEPTLILREYLGSEPTPIERIAQNGENAKMEKTNAYILSINEIAKDCYDLWILSPRIAKEAKPGQFVNLYCRDQSRLLPRPISLCEIDAPGGRLRLVFRVVGAGTREFSTYREGEDISLLGPLGNGFSPVPGKALLLGGGIGIPPMLALAKALPQESMAVLGYRDGTCFLADDFAPYARVMLATEDGSRGTFGTVLDAVRENDIHADVLYACGPLPMLRAVKEYAAKEGLPAQISLEERMACGIGACLSCVCKTKEIDAHTNVKNRRICKDGPVFWAEEVEF